MRPLEQRVSVPGRHPRWRRHPNAMKRSRVLYTSGAIQSEIARLFQNPSSTDRRVVLVAYVGADALRLLPAPHGLRIICSRELGTSHVALKQLVQRGARVEIADRLHMKVYWSEERGCVIGSANLSLSALGKGGLKEAGVVLPPGAVDVDRLVRSAKPRAITMADIAVLAKQERRAAARGFRQGSSRWSAISRTRRIALTRPPPAPRPSRPASAAARPAGPHRACRSGRGAGR